MVQLSKYFFIQRKYGNFIDTVRVYVRGGKGGNGLPKYEGVGGKGGDVYAEASRSYTLRKLKDKHPDKRFIASNGENSRRHCVLGNPGVDVTIKCPLGVTAVTDAGQVLGDLNNHGDRVLLALGGCGGGLKNNYLGENGQAHSVTFDLKLLADVGFVGFPNAGKSTLLRALSKAKPKIASYPFTTIQPNIGIIGYEDLRTISAADLPGLIEGSYLNHGMGHKFLKHCIRTKVLLFIVDIDGFQLNLKFPHRTALETIFFLNRELELYDPELLNKPAILAINKIDKKETIEKLNDLKNSLQHLKEKAALLSDDRRPNQLVKFDAIVPISAKAQLNIDELKNKIRTIIDIYHEKKLQDTEKEFHDDKSVVLYV